MSKLMTQEAREQYLTDLEKELLLGGASFSEWCTFIAKDTETAFIHGADLSTVVMSLACIETYLKTESPELQKQSLYSLVGNETSLSAEEKHSLNKLRRYRNRWIHCSIDDLDDAAILENESDFIREAEEMACLAVKMLLTVLFLNQYV